MLLLGFSVASRACTGTRNTCKHARMHATKEIRQSVIRLHANKEDAHNCFANISALLATLPPLVLSVWAQKTKEVKMGEVQGMPHVCFSHVLCRSFV
jgi:hypothetical protein